MFGPMFAATATANYAEQEAARQAYLRSLEPTTTVSAGDGILRVSREHVMFFDGSRDEAPSFSVPTKRVSQIAIQFAPGDNSQRRLEVRAGRERLEAPLSRLQVQGALQACLKLVQHQMGKPPEPPRGRDEKGRTRIYFRLKLMSDVSFNGRRIKLTEPTGFWGSETREAKLEEIQRVKFKASEGDTRLELHLGGADSLVLGGYPDQATDLISLTCALEDTLFEV